MMVRLRNQLLRRVPLFAAVVTVAIVGVAALGACDDESAGADPAVAEAIAKSRKEHPELWKRKLVVLGFDSCDSDLVDGYVREGKLSHFARLRREGAHGELGSINPLLSPVVWTTIATGMTPQRHGILDFVTHTPEGPVPVSSRMRQADAVWELMSQQGDPVGVVGWLVTYPAEPLNGFIATERMGQLAFENNVTRARDTPQRTWPESLAAEMERVDVVEARDLPLSKMRTFVDIDEREYESTFSETFDPRNRLGNLRLTLSTAETFRGAGERLLSEQRPRFFACYFEAMDAISHMFMPFAPPKAPHIPEREYMKYRTAIEANYVWHDRVLGEFMDLCDEDTTLIVVSDHGFKSGDFRLADSSDFHAKTGAMWHRNYGVLYAWGNGVKRGGRIEGASVYDVAPTLLAAMGYPVPEDMPGKVLADLFESGLPVTTVPTYRGEQRRDELAAAATDQGPTRARTPDEEDQINRLISLGYLGGDRSDPISTQLNLGSALLSQGRTQQAYEEFLRVLARERSPRALSAAAEAALRLNKDEDAEKLIDEALAADPEEFGALLLRGRLLLRRGDLDAAERHVRSVVSRKPEFPHVHILLAQVLQARVAEAKFAGDEEAAHRWRMELIQAYEASLALEPKQFQVLVDLAIAMLSGKRWSDLELVPKAREHLDKSLELHPMNANALNNRATALLRMGNLALVQGRTAEGRKHLEEALTSVEKAIEVVKTRYRGEYPMGWANKAYILWKLERIDDAVAAAGKARELDPSYVLGPEFVEAMAKAGHPIAPPAPKGQSPAPAKDAAPGDAVAPGAGDAAPEKSGE